MIDPKLGQEVMNYGGTYLGRVIGIIKKNADGYHRGEVIVKTPQGQHRVMHKGWLYRYSTLKY